MKIENTKMSPAVIYERHCLIILIINMIILAAMIVMVGIGFEKQEHIAGYECPKCGELCEMTERVYITTYHPEGQDYIDTTYYCPQCDETYHV